MCLDPALVQVWEAVLATPLPMLSSYLAFMGHWHCSRGE